MKGRLLLTLAVAATMLVAASAARANPRNTLQPSNVYFGRVQSGDHPRRVVTVANHTGKPQTIKRFEIAGSGGAKFTLVARKGRTVATCHVGTRLKNGASCVIVVRVKTTRPEFWQSVIMVVYGVSLRAPMSGQWNGGVYADVVA